MAAPSASQRPELAAPGAKPSRLLHQVEPIWRAGTNVSALKCRLIVAAVIRTDGTPDDLIVLSATSSDLASAALMAVRQWRYSPTYLAGKVVELATLIDVVIGINGQSLPERQDRQRQG